jgi:hypothetical protein
MLMKFFKNLCRSPVLKRTFLFWGMFPRYRQQARHHDLAPTLDIQVSALGSVSWFTPRDHVFMFFSRAEFQTDDWINEYAL